jgi:hypothetical protein
MNNLISYNEFVLNEEFSFNIYKETMKNVAKEFKLNFMLISTFGTSIAAFMPIAKHIITHQSYNVPLTTETIILLVITAFGVAFKESAQSDQLKNYIKLNHLGHILRDFVRTIKSFKNIFEYILRMKSIPFITNMLSYTLLLSPFMMIITNLVSGNLITLNELIGCGMSIGAGIITLTFKNIFKIIWDKYGKYVIKFKEETKKQPMV